MRRGNMGQCRRYQHWQHRRDAAQPDRRKGYVTGTHQDHMRLYMLAGLPSKVVTSSAHPYLDQATRR